MKMILQLSDYCTHLRGGRPNVKYINPSKCRDCNRTQPLQGESLNCLNMTLIFVIPSGMKIIELFSVRKPLLAELPNFPVSGGHRPLPKHCVGFMPPNCLLHCVGRPHHRCPPYCIAPMPVLHHMAPTVPCTALHGSHSAMPHQCPSSVQGSLVSLSLPTAGSPSPVGHAAPPHHPGEDGKQKRRRREREPGSTGSSSKIANPNHELGEPQFSALGAGCGLQVASWTSLV